MHWVISSSTVSAVLWMVACLEAKLGTKASTMLVTMGNKRSPNRGTMLLNASKACKLTLLLESVNLGKKASNTCHKIRSKKHKNQYQQHMVVMQWLP